MSWYEADGPLSAAQAARPEPQHSHVLLMLRETAATVAPLATSGLSKPPCLQAMHAWSSWPNETKPRSQGHSHQHTLTAKSHTHTTIAWNEPNRQQTVHSKLSPALAKACDVNVSHLPHSQKSCTAPQCAFIIHTSNPQVHYKSFSWTPPWCIH